MSRQESDNFGNPIFQLHISSAGIIIMLNKNNSKNNLKHVVKIPLGPTTKSVTKTWQERETETPEKRRIPRLDRRKSYGRNEGPCAKTAWAIDWLTQQRYSTGEKSWSSSETDEQREPRLAQLSHSQQPRPAVLRNWWTKRSKVGSATSESTSTITDYPPKQ